MAARRGGSGAEGAAAGSRASGSRAGPGLGRGAPASGQRIQGRTGAQRSPPGADDRGRHAMTGPRDAAAPIVGRTDAPGSGMGAPLKRHDGRAKVTGEARYAGEEMPAGT